MELFLCALALSAFAFMVDEDASVDQPSATAGDGAEGDNEEPDDATGSGSDQFDPSMSAGQMLLPDGNPASIDGDAMAGGGATIDADDDPNMDEADASRSREDLWTAFRHSILGTEKSDILTGGSAADTIWGMDGDDLLEALGADDLVYGGHGDDSIAGGSHEDSLYGGSGDDFLYADGDSAADLVDAGEGADQIFGGFADRLAGGAGADVFVVSDGSHISDFDPSEDRIEIIIAPGTPPEGSIAVEEDATETRVLFMGEIFLTLNPVSLPLDRITFVENRPGLPWAQEDEG